MILFSFKLTNKMENNQEYKETQETHQQEINSTINDVRTKSQFQGISFSEFKKTEVKKELISTLSQSQYEASCYWGAELICAGHYDDLWETITQFYFKYIHVSHPKLCIYLNKRWKQFTAILQHGYTDMELSARNSDKLRTLFGEVICVLCSSNKSHSITTIKIAAADYDIINVREKMATAGQNLAADFYRGDDPRELYVGLNEFAFHLQQHHVRQSCYWMDWVIDFERYVNECKCERRRFAPVDGKHQMDIVWMIWEMLRAKLEGMETPNKQLIQAIMDACMELYSIKYTPKAYKKHRALMYFVVHVLLEPQMTTLKTAEIISNKESLRHYVEHLPLIYARIKQNEHSPNMEYLWADSEGRQQQQHQRSNVERTVRNLEMMNLLENH